METLRYIRSTDSRRIKSPCTCLVKNRMYSPQNVCVIFDVRTRSAAMPWRYVRNISSGTTVTRLACNHRTLITPNKLCCDSKGCRYMLIRGYKQKIATLKRVPTPEESAFFDISPYRNKSIALTAQVKESRAQRVTLGEMVNNVGRQATQYVNNFFLVSRAIRCFIAPPSALTIDALKMRHFCSI